MPLTQFQPIEACEDYTLSSSLALNGPRLRGPPAPPYSVSSSEGA